MVSKRLKELREDKDLLQKDMAKILNITTSAYGYYEQGKRMPDISVLERLADFYGESVDYLLGRTNVRKSIEKASYQDPKVSEIANRVRELSPECLYELNNLIDLLKIKDTMKKDKKKL